MQIFIYKEESPTEEEQEKINAIHCDRVIIVVFGKPDPNQFKRLD
jgi:hypothetical protein